MKCFSKHLIFLDSQVVSHIFRPSTAGHNIARPAHHPATASSSHPSRGAARDLFLHHDRVAQLSTRKDTVLESSGSGGGVGHRLPTPLRRPEVGAKTHLMSIYLIISAGFIQLYTNSIIILPFVTTNVPSQLIIQERAKLLSM